MQSAEKKRKDAGKGNVSPPPVRRKLQSGTTKDAVASFFTPASQKPPENVTWSVVNSTLLVGHYHKSEEEAETPTAKRRKIAAFDLDSTIIKPASGNVRAKDAGDWVWWDVGVPGKLKNLYQEGYQVTILSNQGGINLKGDSKSAKFDQKRQVDFKRKVNAVLNQLDLSVSVYAATEHDGYRKPRIGMWQEMLDYYDLDSKNGYDAEESMFVGDAGGRTGLRKDFASSDRDFASNLGIKYLTPEEFFLHKSPQSFAPSIDFSIYLDEKKPIASFSKTNAKDIVVLCGSPGAGKSTFFWDFLAREGYERVNQDTLKTREKCLKAATAFLESGKSVAVDNTNADRETRAYWVRLAERFRVPARCVVLKADPKLCRHNDAVRALNGPLMNPEGRTVLPGVAFGSFVQRFQEPNTLEGFQDVTVVDFRFRGNEEKKAAWSQYYV